jgi:hypothetical protein
VSVSTTSKWAAACRKIAVIRLNDRTAADISESGTGFFRKMSRTLASSRSASLNQSS